MNLADQIVLKDLQVIADNLKEAEKLQGKTVVITGGAGFLGHYLVLTLVHLNKTRFSQPVKIVAVDNFITGSKKPLVNLSGYDDYDLIDHDVCKPLIIRGKVDYVIHAAGIASPIYYKKYPIQAIEVGTTGTKNFLELCRKKHSQSFLFFSSSEIYGDPDPKHIPTLETYRGNVSCVGPRACYDESKRLGEALTMTYFQHFQSPVKIVRPFNVFGPGMKYNDFRVIPAFLMSALQGKPLSVHGDGQQTRTFCYVTDAVVGVYKVLLSEKNGEVYNIGNDDNEMPMLKLAKLVSSLFPRPIKIKTIPYPADYPGDEPKRRCPDLTKIKRELGYKPKVDLKTGLGRLLAWFRSEYKL